LIFLIRLALWKRTVDNLGFTASSVLMITAKAQHAALGIPLTVGFLLAKDCLSSSRSRLRCTAQATTLLLSTLLTITLGPPDYRPTALYSVIFYQVLPRSSDVRGDLRALGLDESYLPLVGTHAYSSGVPLASPRFVRDFASRTSHVRLLWFFTLRPCSL